MSLGDAASVATLVLFIFYFIGRIWTIRKNTQLMLEDFSLEDASDCVDFADSREIFYHLENSEYGDHLHALQTAAAMASHHPDHIRWRRSENRQAESGPYYFA